MDKHQFLTTSNTRSIYKKHILPPIIYLLILAAMWFITPVSDLVFPTQISSDVSMETLDEKNISFITTTLTDLHFTGYIQTVFGITSGYYYYTFRGNECMLVLLSPHMCEKGLPDIDAVTVRARITKDYNDYPALMTNLAKDLNWTVQGISSQIPPYLISESNLNQLLSLVLLGFYFISGFYAVINLLFSIITSKKEQPHTTV